MCEDLAKHTCPGIVEIFNVLVKKVAAIFAFAIRSSGTDADCSCDCRLERALGICAPGPLPLVECSRCR